MEGSCKFSVLLRTFERLPGSDSAVRFSEWMSLDEADSVEITKQGIEVTVMQ